VSSRLLLALELLLLLVSGLQLWELGQAVATRFGYGYDLEWMEGAMLVAAARARDGLPIYTEPSPDYIPFIYPPTYTALLGALGHLFPLGYPLGRALSILGTGAAALAIGWAAVRAGARWPLAVGCAALFLGTYAETGSFFDLVRLDGLSIGLLGWALAFAVGPGRRDAVVGGLLLAAAFTLKHHAAIFGFPLVLWRWRAHGRREALAFAVAAAAPALLFTIAMELVSGGLFLVWLLGVPASHGMVVDRLLPAVSLSFDPFRYSGTGAMMECIHAAPLVWLLALGQPRWMKGTAWPWVGLVALVTVSLMRGHTGGYTNVLIPMMWAQALWPALVAGASPRPWLAHVVTALVAVQVWFGRDALERLVPTERDAERGAALVEQIRALPGTVLIPHAPWYAVLAGKEPGFALITLWDINHERGPYYRDVRRVRKALETGRWDWLVLPDDKLGYGLKDGYRRDRALDPQGPPTRTGWAVTLRQVWAPRSAQGEAGNPANADAASPARSGPATETASE